MKKIITILSIVIMSISCNNISSSDPSIIGKWASSYSILGAAIDTVTFTESNNYKWKRGNFSESDSGIFVLIDSTSQYIQFYSDIENYYSIFPYTLSGDSLYFYYFTETKIFYIFIRIE